MPHIALALPIRQGFFLPRQFQPPQQTRAGWRKSGHCKTRLGVGLRVREKTGDQVLLFAGTRVGA